MFHSIGRYFPKPSWVDVVVGLVFLALGLSQVGVHAERYWTSQDSINWPSVPGTITSSRIRAGDGRTVGASAIIDYSYRVGGVQFSGSNVSYRDGASPHAVVGRYPDGLQVAVYYRPSTPGESVLEPGPAQASYLVAHIAAFLAVSALGGWAVRRWLVARNV